MPPLIEFNEKARPEMAKPFGGVLQQGHFYKCRNGSVVEVVETPTNVTAVPKYWKCAVFVTGPLMGTNHWWNDNGLYQGQETTQEYKWHIIEETSKPAPSDIYMTLGQRYVTKSGDVTGIATLYIVHDNQVAGPVFMCELVKGPSVYKCLYNHKGLYVGTKASGITWPDGNKNSVRTIVAEYKVENILAAMEP